MADGTNSKELKRLRRSESYFGLHFDFHADKDCTDIGSGLVEEELHGFLAAIKPDFVQCDSKGHPGLSSYPTKIGYAAPGFAKDPLKVWRKVTKELGIALYVHHSGVWDTEALRHHPEWARIDEKGSKDINNTSVFGPYVDELLIPQLQELHREYEVDGVWLDGECWATAQDYKLEVRRSFLKAHGLPEDFTLPQKVGEPYFEAFTDFCRVGFRNYLSHYTSVLHERCPGLQIASNWAYSSYMPEPVTTDVDFLSGDYPMKNSVNLARWETRCLMYQGISWDLMAWSFCADWGEQAFCTKTATQLKQEAAVVISLGGAFQIYSQQRRDASVVLSRMPLLKEVSEFCRERQSICHGARSLAEVAVLFSGESYYRCNERLFSAWESDIVDAERGVLQCLLDAHFTVDVLMEHHLDAHLERYQLLVIPETQYMSTKVAERISHYASTGGRVLLIGPKPINIFAETLGLEREFEKKRDLWLRANTALAGLSAVASVLPEENKTKPIGHAHLSNDPDSEVVSIASRISSGEGEFGLVYCQLGQAYFKARTPALKTFLSDVVSTFITEPIVRLDSPVALDVALMENHGRTFIHLVNTGGDHENPNVNVFESIPPFSSVRLHIHQALAANGTYFLQPQGLELVCKQADSYVEVLIPEVAIHTIVEIVPKTSSK